MSKTFRAGLVQMCTGRDVKANIKVATELIREAASAGADYVQTPETTNIMELERERLLREVAFEDANEVVTHFSQLADQLGIWLHVGSLVVKLDEEKTANRSLLFAPDGVIRGRYDKIHMFDVDLPGGETYRESRHYRPGTRAVLANLPWGQLGMTICYDVRFPHLYRALSKAGAKFLSVPAAFTVPTGKAHWHTLLRARAIENQCFVMAAAQGGEHENGRSTFGHSLVVSPWGEVLAEADGVAQCVITADIDLELIKVTRQRVPSLEHDRPFDVATDGDLTP